MDELATEFQRLHPCFLGARLNCVNYTSSPEGVFCQNDSVVNVVQTFAV